MLFSVATLRAARDYARIGLAEGHVIAVGPDEFIVMEYVPIRVRISLFDGAIGAHRVCGGKRHIACNRSLAVYDRYCCRETVGVSVAVEHLHSAYLDRGERTVRADKIP